MYSPGTRPSPRRRRRPPAAAHLPRLVATAREHGLNHFRFHSWCPPEAAFQAADEAGCLLHVESPLRDQQRKLLECDFPTDEEPWRQPARFGRDAEAVRFIEAEVTRILEAYGNHPSFAMLCIGNELAGDYGVAVPVMSHEIGQWVTHPDYGELSKYTGTLKPRDLKTRPAARQLRHCLLSYMGSERFRPAVELDPARDAVSRLIRRPSPARR